MKRYDLRYLETAYILIAAVAPLIYVIVQLNRTSGLFFPPDEFGYWENAARMIGLDWSGSTFMQSYYAKGYSMLLYPLVSICSRPLVMYKCALVINAVLFALQALLVPLFIRETSPKGQDDIWVYAASLAAVFYPSHFVYMNYTIAETLISLLVTLSVFLLAKYENTKRPVFAALAVASSLALMLTHFRTAGVLVSVGVMIFIMWNKDRSKPVSMRSLVICFILICVMVLAVAASPLRSGYKYLDDQFDRLARFLTFEGAVDIVMGLAGKLFYISVSTFGLFFLCIGRIWRRRRESLTGVIFALAFFISIMISAVFFVGGKGIDYLVYGRYTEVFAPLIVCMGLCELQDGCQKAAAYDKKFGSICSAGLAVTAILLVIYAAVNRMNVYMNDFIIGLAWPFGRRNPLVNQLLAVPALIAIFAIWAFVWMMGKHMQESRTVIAAAVLTAVFIVIGVYMSEICVYHFHEVDRKDLALFEKVVSMNDEGRRVDFIRPPGVNYIGHLQFYMFDRAINYIDGPEPEAFTTDVRDVVVTYPNYEFLDRISERYNTLEKSAHFIVLYNDPDQ